MRDRLKFFIGEETKKAGECAALSEEQAYHANLAAFLEYFLERLDNLLDINDSVIDRLEEYYYKEEYSLFTNANNWEEKEYHLSLYNTLIDIYNLYVIAVIKE